MDYRSEIDGLRAISVIGVILYHAGFELFKGGFLRCRCIFCNKRILNYFNYSCKKR